MSNWQVAPNPTWAGQTPQHLTESACHDRSHCADLVCSCGFTQHVHESQIKHVAISQGFASGLRNHEIREILVGLWSRLDRDDQIDHIAELQHYLKNEPGTFLSGIAAQIRDA